MMNIRSTKRDEQGLVAIVVTMIIMLILTLIVTGFAQLARREQREALDRQLAAQATYAAESGINLGKKILKEKVTTPNYTKNDCATAPPLVAPGETKLDGDNVEVTCLLIKTELDNLVFNNIQQNKSTITPIFPSGAAMDRLIISWQNAEGDNGINITDPPFFVNGNDWNSGGKNVGMLRIELVDATANTREEQHNNSYVFYARPRTTGSGETSYKPLRSNPEAQGEQVYAKCNDPVNPSKYTCRVSVTGVSIGQKYYIRMTAIYNPANAYLCAGNTTNECVRGVYFKEAQAEIDSTGRANDVVKRILVRTNAKPNYNGSRNIAEFALDSSDSICKLNSVWPGGGSAGSCP